jgi:hypothetical protein
MLEHGPDESSLPGALRRYEGIASATVTATEGCTLDVHYLRGGGAKAGTFFIKRINCSWMLYTLASTSLTTRFTWGHAHLLFMQGQGFSDLPAGQEKLMGYKCNRMVLTDGRRFPLF